MHVYFSFKLQYFTTRTSLTNANHNCSTMTPKHAIHPSIATYLLHICNNNEIIHISFIFLVQFISSCSLKQLTLNFIHIIFIHLIFITFLSVPASNLQYRTNNVTL